MVADEPDVAEETGEQAERVEHAGGNVVSTSLSGMDFIVLILIVVIGASLVLTLFYGRQSLSNIGIGLTYSGVSPLEAFLNGIASFFNALFGRLDRWINPGGYVVFLKNEATMVFYIALARAQMSIHVITAIQ